MLPVSFASGLLAKCFVTHERLRSDGGLQALIRRSLGWPFSRRVTKAFADSTRQWSDLKRYIQLCRCLLPVPFHNMSPLSSLRTLWMLWLSVNKWPTNCKKRDSGKPHVIKKETGCWRKGVLVRAISKDSEIEKVVVFRLPFTLSQPPWNSRPKR